MGREASKKLFRQTKKELPRSGGINADHMTALEMIHDDLICYRKELAVAAFAALDRGPMGLATNAGGPIIRAGRRVALLTSAAHPEFRE